MNTASQILFQELGVPSITNVKQSQIVDILLSVAINSGGWDNLKELLAKHVAELKESNVNGRSSDEILKLGGSNLMLNLLTYYPTSFKLYLLLSVDMAMCSSYRVVEIDKSVVSSCLNTKDVTRQATTKKLVLAVNTIALATDYKIYTKSQGDNIQFLLVKGTPDKSTMLKYVKESGFQSPSMLDRVCRSYN